MDKKKDYSSKMLLVSLLPQHRHAVEYREQSPTLGGPPARGDSNTATMRLRGEKRFASLVGGIS